MCLRPHNQQRTCILSGERGKPQGWGGRRTSGQREQSVAVGLDRCAQRVGGGPGRELGCEAAQRSWGTSDVREGQKLPVLKVVLAAWWGRRRACAMGGAPQIHVL